MQEEPAVWCLHSWLEVESPAQRNGKNVNNDTLLLTKKTHGKKIMIFLMNGGETHGSCVSQGERGRELLHVGTWNDMTT